MVCTCCVPGCKTGYKSNKNPQKISLFRFPKNESLKAKWIKIIPRENWTWTDSHRVCANHFHEEDFETESTDHRASRKANRDITELKQARLKPNAIPRIFMGLPKYLSKELPSCRSTSKCTAAARYADDTIRLEQQIEQAFAEDKFDNFESFKSKIASTTLPSGFFILDDSVSIHFVYLQCREEDLLAPKLAVTVTVTQTLTVRPFFNSLPVPKSAYRHVLNHETVNSITEVCNILALCKVLSETAESNTTMTDFTSLLDLAISSLQRVVALDWQTNHFDASCLPLIKFIIEQLQLLAVEKYGRRYSVDTSLKSFF